MPRPPEELDKAFKNQMRALGSSVRNWLHNGADFETARIATAVANLVYDRGRAVSILTQLGAKADMAFLSSGAVEQDGNLLDESPLVGFPIAGVFPPLYAQQTPAEMAKIVGYKFEGWWKVLPIYKTGGRVRVVDGKPPTAQLLFRKDLVESLRDQDGGSHFDADLSHELYAKLARDGTGWSITQPDGSHAPILGMVPAMMAQVGWELYSSVCTRFPELPTNI